LRQNVRPELVSFAERLTHAVKAAGGLNIVIRRTGKARPTLDRWMNAQADPSFTDMAEIASACEVSLDWLATGRHNLEFETSLPHSIPDLARIRLITDESDVASASDHVVVPATALGRRGLRPAQVHAWWARGDRMVPTIGEGSLVLIDLTAQVPVDGGIFAVRGERGLHVSRFQMLTDGGVALIADNRDVYEVERLTRSATSALDIVGRCFWTERAL
jgi:phage repressor protein C with HTH and peptisase S24 domain